jgi:hypothetical protein
MTNLLGFTEHASKAFFLGKGYEKALFDSVKKIERQMEKIQEYANQCSQY